MGWRWYVNNLSGLIRSCCPWIECLKHYAGKSLWKVSFAANQNMRLFCTFSKHSAKCVSQVFILGSLLGRRIAFQISLMYYSIDGNLFLRTPFVLSLHSLLVCVVLLGTLLQFHICLSLLNIGIWTCSRIFSLSKYLRERLWRKSREIPPHFAGCILPEYTSNTLSLSRLWKWRKKFVNKSKALFFHNKITTFEILMAALPKPWQKSNAKSISFATANIVKLFLPFDRLMG